MTFDFNAMRAKATNRKNAFTAKAELGKLGITVDEPATDAPLDQLPRAETLAYRASLRRASNALMAHAREKDENLTDSVVTAMEHINAHINLVSAGLDFQESAEQSISAHAGVSAATDRLKDTDGNQIGTLLTANDLRNESAIAKKLRAHSGRGSSDSEQVDLTTFMRGVAGMRTTEQVRNTLSEGTNTAGGYTVPTVLLPGILNALVPSSSLLSAGANVAMLNTPASSFRIAAVDTIPKAGWREESGEILESEPAFRAVDVTPRSLAFRFKISRELLADSPNIENALRTAIGQAFAKEIDRAGLMGSGVAPEIRGLRNIVGVNKLPMGTNGFQMISENAWRTLIRARRLIVEANAPAPNAVIMSPREDETLSLLTDTTGQPLRRPATLEDWKFFTTSQVPTNEKVGTATNGAAMYVGDFSMFTIYLRESVSIQLLKELYAETGEVGFVAHTRVDVAAAYPKAFAVVEGITVPA
ncbi:phage major capsid protein [Xanthomonas cassavae CFBP 4642]|uniref:Phage major capsid protein n=1 Tax=Xanthomonas cassavae CFBP 4642 TaxID=1219375 RepID=A0ABS8HHX3_9XANT|nr:phage major capsid protein [Xanthomonas cassavae]MCC4621779.1 phage major capsid protein [Xanthomonas cassavae CFBP 4642]